MPGDSIRGQTEAGEPIFHDCIGKHEAAGSNREDRGKSCAHRKVIARVYRPLIFCTTASATFLALASLKSVVWIPGTSTTSTPPRAKASQP